MIYAFCLSTLLMGAATLPSQELLSLHNAERVRHKLPLLIIDLRLQAAAQKHASAMALAKKISHDRWVEGIRAVGYHGSSMSQNVALGQLNAKAVTKAWMRSPSHKQNILGDYQYVGFGVVRAGGRLWWCANFGRP